MAATRVAPPVAEQILEALKGRGYRNTKPRRILAFAIAEQDRHFTAEGLRQQLPTRLGRATVYRILRILVETGVLCRVLLEDDELHYQLSHRDHHHHLLCVECGLSEDLTGCDIEEALAGASALHGFELSSHRLEVYGRCRECRRAALSETKPNRDHLVHAK